ncbi:hypothetical protein J7E97_31495 [Streptomyces sp. ISL-66]|uniref:hypothetical protein n=1 Tax=Streptomyces sp. ISL-66 TaxID=2819186 RepID=UPI001BEA5BE7|nr:hypothetical protein [Streptomyces sp. ISL-66]MBT2472259.1 hypothetical protein [Streptomyces sp. ISL-66]
MARQHGEEETGRPPHGEDRTGRPEGPAARGAELLTLVERTLGTGTAAHVPGDGWIRLTLPLDDGGPAPVTVDVVADTLRAPRGIAYLLPGGGLNFHADFFTTGTTNTTGTSGTTAAAGAANATGTAGPTPEALAHRLRRAGLLVVGVTPREDAASAADIGPDRGLAAHRRDLAAVVAALDGVLALPYQYLGHSAGGALALDAAAHDASPRLTRVVVLDTTGPYSGDLAVRAAQTLEAYEAQLARGEHAAAPGLAALIARAVSDPAGPSPVPWPPDPELRFTHAGLAHFALVRTSLLPGPANWIYVRGHSAGSYTFGATPAEDSFSLTHTPLATWHTATAALGSGLVPTALMRDLAAIWAGDEETYAIDWERIGAEVVWINTELGRGDHSRGPRLIRAGGNQRVGFTVVPDYGHGDVVWSATAAADVWPLL